MRVLEFTCPRCRGKIRAEIPDRESCGEEDSILLTCSEKEGAGCGWMGYLPRSRGVRLDPQ
jgi:hypothetical protein